MFRKIARWAVVPFAALGMVLAVAAAPAGAAVVVHPDGVVNAGAPLFTGPSDAGGIASAQAATPCQTPLPTCTDSMAGYYTNAFAQTFTKVDATFTLNAQAEGIGISTIHTVDSPDNPSGSLATSIRGAIGAQLCQNTSSEAAQIGAAYVGGGEFALGYTTGDLDGLTSDPCVGGGVVGLGVVTPDQFSLLGVFPAGSKVQTQIQQVYKHGHPSGLLFSAQLVGGVTNYTYFLNGHNFYPNEAGAGLQADTAGLSAPASNDLTDFSGVTATSQGVTAGLAAWNAVEVAGSQDGMSPALLTPSDSLSPVSGTNVCTNWHAGHRVYWGPKHHRHFRWVKGFCSAWSHGNAASVFSVSAGTPVS